jgi:hypothetical protein
MDDFFGVGDFEETRKHRTKAIYIIAQNTEHLHKYNAPNLDTNARYNFDKKDVYISGDGRGHSWVGSIYLQPQTGTKETIKWCPFSQFVPLDRQKAGTNITTYIDKSGYIVWSRSADRKHRARVLKAERERAAVLAADWTNRENELKNKLEKAKTHLCDLIQRATTRENAHDVRKAASHLYDAMWRMDQLTENTFHNIQSKEQWFDNASGILDALLSIEGVAQ